SYFHPPPPPETHTLSLHDALPIFRGASPARTQPAAPRARVISGDDPLPPSRRGSSASHGHVDRALLEARAFPPEVLSRGIAPRRSEEHTSELQSRGHLVCRLLLEK